MRMHEVLCDVCREKRAPLLTGGLMPPPWRMRDELDVCSDECEIALLERRIVARLAEQRRAG